MKALSIKEPFASLIMFEKKKIETRSWKTNYRGEIYIHASKTKNKIDDIEKLNFLMDLLPSNYKFKEGNIICKCILKDCIYMDQKFIDEIKKNKQEYMCGNYKIGRYAWVLDDIKIIEEIPINGKLGIWNF